MRFACNGSKANALYENNEYFFILNLLFDKTEFVVLYVAVKNKYLWIIRESPNKLLSPAHYKENVILKFLF